MAENTGNTEWKITASGEKELTVVLPDCFTLPDEVAEILPETLARMILQTLEEKKSNKDTINCGCYKSLFKLL